MNITLRLLLLFGVMLVGIGSAKAQPCFNNWNLTVSTPPVNGTYACGQTVTFCITITGWNQTSANWFHGIEANFGPGWDMSTLVPGPPPPSCMGAGTWGFYNSVQGTAFTNIGPQGPGFFFDLNNDGNPGNNFGDNCTGSSNWQFCWTISVLSGPACVAGTSLSTGFDTYSDSQTGSWGSSACGGDPIVPVPGPPTVTGGSCAVNAGTNGDLTLCSTEGPTALFGSLGGTPDAGGTWTAPDGSAFSGTFTPGISTAGIHTYTVTSVSPPCTESATVSITVTQQPNAGTNGNITVCASDTPFALFGSLGGSPNNTGTWTDPSGAPFSGIFLPSSDPTGIYTYTVNGAAPCVTSTATVEVTVTPTPNAGNNGALTVCSSGPAVSLFGILGGAPASGGTWTGPSGAPANGTYLPGTGDPGIYTYTVAGIAPCPSSSATVTITEVPLPVAGTGGAGTFCQSAPVVDLFSLLEGTPDQGGTWTNASGASIAGTIDPATAQSGAFIYTVAGIAPCTAVSATVNITIVPTVTAGTNGTVALCSTAGPTVLFTALGGNPAAGGTWTGPNGAASTGTFQPGTNTAGDYTYTVNGTPPCANSTSIVSVTVSPQPTAGTGGAGTYCQSAPVVDLFSLLDGTPDQGGTWTNASGASVAGTIDPATAQSGTFLYTVAGIAPCTAVSATVNITIVPTVSAGTNGTVALCSSAGPTVLFTALGGNPAVGGTWTGPNGAASTGTFQPGTNTAGDYTYTVNGTPPCANSTSVVTVTVSAQPTAGANGTSVLCSTSTNTALLTNLGSNATLGGTWTAPDGSASTGTIDPATAAPGAYLYTVSAPAPCTSVQATVTVTINQQSSAGTNGTLNLCNGGTPQQLVTALGGMPGSGGVWSGPSALAGGVYDPGTGTPGVYTYSVPSAAPCTTAIATVTVAVTAQPNAGLDGAATLCSSSTAAFSLFTALSGSPSTGGVWTGPTGQAVGATLDPGLADPGTYTYSIAVPPPCVSVSSTVDISVVDPALAGLGGSQALCENGDPVDPSTWLTGPFDQGGTWTTPDGTTITLVDPAVALPGTYQYTVQGPAPCPAAQTTVVLSISELPFAGSDAILSVCADAGTTDLFGLLGTNAELGGTWTGPTGAASNTFLPGSSAEGVYSYTVIGQGACSASTASANVITTVFPLPLAVFTLSPAQGCAPHAVGFTNATAATLQAATWTFGDGGSSAALNASHTYGAGGTYTVGLTVTDVNGCTADTTAFGAVYVSEGPPALFTVDPLRIVVDRPTFNVSLNALSNVTYHWIFEGDTIAGGSEFSYTIAPPRVGVYELCLVATDTLGCSNTQCLSVTVVDDITIHVPNAFTPDGDGVNDVFAPILVSVDEQDYLFTVFDRWGSEVFSTKDITIPWNGGYRNQGEVLPTGVYVWQLRGKDPFSADRKELIGSVTLLK